MGRAPSSERNAVAVFSSAVAVAALLVAGVAVAVSNGDGSPAAAAAASAGSPAATTVEVSLTEFAIDPKVIEVPAGDVTIEFTNDGAIPHDLSAPSLGVTSPDVNGGGAGRLELQDLQPGTYELICRVPGHPEAGMRATLVVEGGAAAGTGTADAAAAGQATHGHDGDAGSGAAVIDFAAAPAADWKPFDPSLQPAPGGTEHTITMRATETVVEVAPGVTQELWTFDDQVPGPILRGKVGDLFTITLVNDGKLGHSIDFHASEVAWNDEMRTLQPGESLVYQYRAEHAGFFMYHCGTAPALHHIGNGMYGGIIIDPPDLPAVDHEFVLVQSELYLGPEGGPGDLAKMQAEQDDAIVFNGYVNQYRHAPIRVEKDERVRVWVLDAGPSENSAFHVVGTVFDTVWKEGAYLLRPDGTAGGSQVLDLQPAQGGFVEFTLAEDGLYPIVTHKFANVGKGALGLFQAGDVDPAGGGGH